MWKSPILIVLIILLVLWMGFGIRDTFVEKRTEGKPPIADSSAPPAPVQVDPGGARDLNGIYQAPTQKAEITNGRDWLEASLTQRREQCNIWAGRIQNSAPGITGEFLFDAFQEFYDSSKPGTLREEATQMVGVFAALYMAEQ